ncbi:MAG: hypothetical protein JWQ54_792 [Mucilaginibacter sp.]|nr:hypothetical protein [Mucilaginibacter sp.]
MYEAGVLYKNELRKLEITPSLSESDYENGSINT